MNGEKRIQHPNQNGNNSMAKRNQEENFHQYDNLELEHLKGNVKEAKDVEVAGGPTGPISRDVAMLSLRCPIPRDTFSRSLAAPQSGAIPLSPWCLVSHRHICAIPHCATYRAIIVRYPIKKNKQFADTLATSIARCEKYRLSLLGV